MNNAVMFAHEILSMQEKIDSLEGENKRLADIESKYNKMLNISVSNGKIIHNQAIDLLLNK